MMDSNSELVVKEKHINLHPFDWETCEFLIKLKSAGWRRLQVPISSVGWWWQLCHRVDVPYFVPFPSLPTNYSDMNFPVPDF